MPGDKPGKRYEKLKKIGEGTYGSVTKVLDTQLNVFVAIKKLKFHQQQETIPIYALRQIACLRELQHPNIVKQFSIIVRVYDIKYEAKKKKLIITFEFIEQTLDDYIRRMGVLSPYSVKHIMFQILAALKYLETHGYMHRDLKPQNIMITTDKNIKLIDFGQAKKLPFQSLFKEKQTLEVSTLWYKAPELLLGNAFYNNKIQIWAVGCIFAELANGRPLFSSTTQIQQIFQIFKLLGTPKIEENKYMKEWQYMAPTLPKFEASDISIQLLGKQGNQLLKRMLTINPSTRIGISQALHHPYFQGFY